MSHTSLQDSRAISEHVNAINAHRTNRATAAANFIVAMVVALLLSALVINFALPCEGASLCLAAVVPTHRNWAQRMVDRYQAWRLRYHIGIAAKDLHYQEEQLLIARWECEHLPLQLKVTREHITALEHQLRALGAPVEA